MFGALVFDRDPLEWRNVPALVEAWVQNAGWFGAVGALIGVLYAAFRMRPADRARIPSWQVTAVVSAIAAAFVCFIVCGILRIPALKAAANAPPQTIFSARSLLFQRLCLTVGGACGLLAAGLPFLRGMFQLRARRIFAIAKLSFKEAVRRRVLYVFSLLLLVFMFASWFVSPKPEDQVRTYVYVVYLSMTALLLLAGCVIAAFSIPADIRTQTIHTILTKPVERFEVVMGRFLGFAALMSIVLAVMSGISLLYIVRGVSQEAAEESLKAREPMHGDLSFLNTTRENRGESVGREWDYRSYITSGPPGKQPTAIWAFDAVPKRVADRETVRCEFSFDIFRTTKGVENKGVACTFRFVTENHDPALYREYLESLGKGKRPDMNLVAEKFGLYEVAGKDVTDYHTQYIDVPGSLFKKSLEYKGTKPPVRVQVTCSDQTQFVGMAKHDLYLRLDDPEGGSERMSFAWNFLKGTFGLWARLCLIIGVAVALSTYLSGVISLLITFLLYAGGVSLEFIRTVVEGKNVGGGPTEAAYRLLTRTNMNAPLDKSTGAIKVFDTFDIGFRWGLQRILDLLPDVDRFDLSNYVEVGFNIPMVELVMNLLLLIGYLLPWAVLAYYLLKWREVASST